MSTYCAKCGVENGDDYRFCAACGARLAEPAGDGVPTDGTLVVREPTPPQATPRPAEPSRRDQGASTDPSREMDRPDATLVVRKPGRPAASLGPSKDMPSSAPQAPFETGGRERGQTPPSPEDTLVVRVPSRSPTPTPLPMSGPSGSGTATTPPRAPGAPTPTFDTGIADDEPAVGRATISAFESRLLERPVSEARPMAFLRRGETVQVLHYHGGYAAVRRAGGETGFIPRQALDSQPTAPEGTAPEEAFVLLPNVARVRTAAAALRAGPSRLADPVRELRAGEPIQLQAFEAHFARVRTADGTEGYVERAQIGSAAASSAPINIPLGTWAVAAAALLVFFGSLAPWFKQCSVCSSTSGVDTAEGWFTLLLAVAGVALLFGQRWYPAIPAVRFRWGVSAAGALIVLIALIDKANNSDASTQFGLYLTMLSGIGMAVAPWADELVARARAGKGTA